MAVRERGVVEEGAQLASNFCYVQLLGASENVWGDISGETLCRDNCQLIGMPFFHTRSAGKNNRN